MWECIGGLEEKGRRRKEGTDNKERAAVKRLRSKRWGMGDEGGGAGGGGVRVVWNFLLRSGRLRKSDFALAV